jgi:hypothetical protein
MASLFDNLLLELCLKDYEILQEVVNESTMIPKKLSFTPAPLPGKKMKCATQVGGTVRKSILSSPLANNGSSKKPPRSYKFKPNMPILPKVCQIYNFISF